MQKTIEDLNYLELSKYFTNELIVPPWQIYKQRESLFENSFSKLAYKKSYYTRS